MPAPHHATHVLGISIVAAEPARVAVQLGTAGVRSGQPAQRPGLALKPHLLHTTLACQLHAQQRQRSDLAGPLLPNCQSVAAGRFRPQAYATSSGGLN